MSDRAIKLLNSPHAGRSRFAIAGAFAIAYVAADLIVRPIAAAPFHITPWYPGAGIGFAAFLLTGWYAFPFLFAARFALLFWAPPLVHPSFAGALAQAFAGVACYALGAMLVRRSVPLDEHAWRVRDVGILIAGIAVSAMAAAVLGIVPLPAGEIIASRPAQFSLFAAGDAIGGFIVVPLLLFVLRPDRRRARVAVESADVYAGSPDERPASATTSRRSRALELLGESIALAGALGLAWGLQAIDSPLSAYAWLVSFLPIFWIAEREGLRGAAVAVAVNGIACMAMAATVGVGPSRIMNTQAMMLALAVSGLMVGAANTAREDAAARYWNLIASAAEGVWRLDRDGRTLYVNARMADILGLSPGDVAGRMAKDFIAPESYDAWVAQRAQRHAGRAGAYETRLVRPDGSRANVIVSAIPVRSVATGEIVGSVAIATDVTRMRELESRERDAQQLLQAAFRTARDAMILFRAGDGTVVDVNDVWCDLAGYSRDEVIGRSQRELNVWADPADSARLAEAIREHGAVRDFEAVFNRRLPNGGTTQGHALVSAHPVHVDGDTYYLITGRDITSEKRADRAQAPLRRLQELGRLAGGVAHDFNNLLTVMLAYAQIVRLELHRPDDRLLVDIGEIEQACLRGADLTKRLLAFSRLRPIDPRPVDINEVITATQGMLGTIAGERISVTIDVAPDLPRIMADPGQLDQVMLNLAVNARDAMPAGGALHVRTRLVHAEPGEVATTIGPDALPGDYIEVTVSDTGVGMDETTRRRAFEPFFTTKGSSEGAGIGLSVVAGVVRQARGGIRIESVPGEGTDVRLYWPVAALAPVPAIDDRDERGARDAEGRVVLIVEDDITVRRVMCRLLEDEGYRVFSARDGARGLACVDDLRDAGTPPDLVIADIVMPVIGGYELAAQMATAYPDIPVILMTGHAQWDSPDDVPANVAGHPLQKPFDVGTLRRVIAQALEGSTSGAISARERE